MKNYCLIEEMYIEDIDSNVMIYEHIKTKAKVACLKNKDKNKVFTIAFRTPPINSTGLTHILEHSVLCGSKKYPVKDPFVELIKSSLSTFLNAFTFPDKTMYPCASMNDKDFKNLMDVYLDSVFYPNIYEHEEIFMQEGWHYKIDNIEDDIEYTGVVYNEMKGAFSDPEQVLGRQIFHSLFKDNCYGYESGGDPTYIPDLSYNEFLDFHKKYYHPSNSYIFLYGDLDFEERLTYLDNEYLSKFEYDDFNTVIKRQEPFTKPSINKSYYPISKDESLDNKTYLSYNLALDTNLSTMDLLALNATLRILFNEPGAIIKQAILDSKIGTDVDFSFETGINQPLLSIVVKGAESKNEEAFISLIDSSIKDVINKGIDKESVKAFLDYSEFKNREAKFGMPKGIIFAMTMLDTWLYNDKDHCSRLIELKYYDKLRDLTTSSYYEDLLTKYFINNTHKSYVVLEPSYTCKDESDEVLKNKLKEYKNSLSKEELEALVNLNKELKVYQETPSTQEQIATLPQLNKEDITITPEKFNLEVVKRDYELLFSEYNTKGINYNNLYFDISHLDYKLVPYVKLLSSILSLVSTKNKTYQEIGRLVNSYTGGLNASYVISQTYHLVCKSNVIVSFSYLDTKANQVFELVNDILFNTSFKDTKRLYELLCMAKNNLESYISYRGNGIALVRAGSRLDEASFLNDSISGISYLDFISNLIKNFDNLKDELVSNLEYLYENIFTKSNLKVGFTASNYQNTISYIDDLYNKLNDKSNLSFNQKFIKKEINEAIKTQYNVNYVAKYGSYKDLSKYNGSFLVLSNAINMDYLWMKVRVLGGAYGCSSMVSPLGYIGFTSYRDPNIKNTYDIYNGVLEFIDSISNCSEEEIFKYKIGAVASQIVDRHNSDRGNRAQLNHIIGLTYEYTLARFKEVLETKAVDFIKCRELFKEALENSCNCVIGNEVSITKDEALFNVSRNLN